MRRVEDLVAALRELAQHAVEVPLRVRAQVELRLLDQQDEAAQVRREQALHAPRRAASPPSACGPVMLGERRLEELGDVGCARAGGRRDERPRAEVRRQEEHRRRARAVEVERVGRAWRRGRSSPLLELRLEVDAPRACRRGDVVDRRRRRRGLEQRPDRGEHGRLAARGLADERAHRARLELELARRAVALDRDPLERRHHRLTVPRASRDTRPGRRAPSAGGSAGSAGGARRRRARAGRRGDGRARPRRVEVTRLERAAGEIAREDDVHDVLADEARASARSSRRAATGPSTGSSSLDPDLLRELAVERVDEALAAS